MKFSLHTALNVVQPEFYSGWSGDLNGPCGDAQSLAAELSLAGFTSQSLINDDATFANYRASVRELAAKTSEGDAVVLHHSHHGGRLDSGIFGGFNETLCLSDGEVPDLKWMDCLANAGFKPGTNVIAILDCCHSGGMDRSRPLARGKARPRFISPKLITWPVINRAPVDFNLIILPACRDNETAVEAVVGEIAEVRGGWTWGFVSALQHARAGQARLLLPDLYEGARKYCAEHFPAQHPRIAKLGRIPGVAWQTRIA